MIIFFTFSISLFTTKLIRFIKTYRDKASREKKLINKASREKKRKKGGWDHDKVNLAWNDANCNHIEIKKESIKKEETSRDTENDIYKYTSSVEELHTNELSEFFSFLFM